MQPEVGAQGRRYTRPDGVVARAPYLPVSALSCMRQWGLFFLSSNVSAFKTDPVFSLVLTPAQFYEL